MPRKKIIKPLPWTGLTGPLFDFVDGHLTEENYLRLLLDVLGPSKPMGYYPVDLLWGKDTRFRRPTLKDVFEVQMTFREDLATWFGPCEDKWNRPWKADLRRQFQRALMQMVDPIATLSGSSRFKPRCSECRKRFTPRRSSQTTCSPKCRERRRRKSNTDRKAAARA